MFLTSTFDKIRLVTNVAVNVDVHASFADLNAGAVTPGRKNTAITTATTTDIIDPPASSTYRVAKRLMVKNKSAITNVTVTVIHTDGTTAIELYSAELGPGAMLHYAEDLGFFSRSTLVSGPAPWAGQMMGCCNDGNPNYLLNQIQLAGNVSATPTNIGITTARCELFRPAFDLTANRLRFFGLAVVAGVYTAAIYRFSDLARITPALTLTSASNAWGSADITGTVLTAGTLYFAAASANVTGTTAGIQGVGGTTAAGTGLIPTAPNALPGNLDSDLSMLSSYRFQFAVTAGAMPTTAATLAAQAAWTGGMPAFWLDANTAP